MKKFVFTLEKVLSVKEQILDVQKNELLQLQLELKEIEDAILQNHAEFKRYNAEVNEKMKSGTKSTDIEVYKNYFKALDAQEQELKLKRLDAIARIESKQEEIVNTKTEISGLEKLKEKQLAEYNKAARKQQELEIEEFLSEKISGVQQ